MMSVTVHSIAANSNVSRHLESPLVIDEIHSVQTDVFQIFSVIYVS